MSNLYIFLFCLLGTTLQAQIVNYPHVEGFEGESSWIDVTGDNLNWTKNSGRTPSDETGPMSAYYGSYYVFLESSSPNYPNKIAYLVSPTYDLTDASTAEISFHYHMDGDDMGSLKIESSINAGASWITFWSVSGGQGDTWNTYTKNLDYLCGNIVKFRIVGITGSGYTGDMALDQITVTAEAYTGSGRSTDKNFIETSSPQTKQGFSGAVIKKVDYYDGLGRLDQSIQIGATPEGKDLTQPTVYDKYGRETRKYLPFAGTVSTGEHNSNEIAVSNWTPYFGSAEDNYAFAESVLEASPLNRVLEQGAPGTDWQVGSGHTVKMEYLSNGTSEVLLFDVNNITKTSNAYYIANQLYKTVSKDENWTSGVAHTTEEFKDKQGQVILKRSYLDNGTALNTYYVYDDFGLLRYVLPPKAFEVGATSITGTELNQLCYQYKYDGRKRMTQKRLPGADWVYMLYDSRDRLIMIRDGNLENSGQWAYTLYDELNRPMETGVCTAGSFDSLDDIVNASSNYIPSNRTAHAYAYYDNYDDSSSWGYAYTEPSGFTENTRATSVKGMVTATKTKNLENSTWLQEVFYYDKYGRLLQSYKKNHLGGYDRITSLYDFTGNVLLTEQYHKRLSSSSPITIRERFEYDHAKRLTHVYHKIGSQSEILMVENKYDELGQLIEKNLHNNIQSVDYRYNIRGWLTSINNANLSNDGVLNNDSNDLFGMELAYNQYLSGLSSTTNEQFNGNISAIKWKRKDQSNTKGYLFTYDALNRLKKADYKYLSSSWVNSSAYDVYGNHSGQIGYDLNGNIASLVRKNGSGTIIDNLTYTYTGNQLKNVEDAAGDDGFKELVSNSVEYTFDDNGNLIDDDNRGHVIQYNLLNLPNNLNSGTLQYEYSAAGEKLRKVYQGSVTEYIGNFVYNGSSLAYIITSEGRIVKSGSTYLYEYYLKDHLGNTRVSFQANGSTPVVLQNQDYYPFGMAMNTIQNDNRYLYNGKELQDDVINGDNLDWYDYGARMYDPEIARWLVIDPAVEDAHHDYSPYAYVYNNPIRYSDPFGLDSLDAVALTEAAQDAVATITSTYGSTTAQCNRGVSTALEDLTGSTELNGLTANQQVDHMTASDDFEDIDQDETQEAANNGEIVIAGKKETNSGHVVMGVPGEETRSGSWNDDVPQVMDTGANKRTSKKGINFSWGSASKDNITYFKYTGDTYSSKTYNGGQINEVNITAKGRKREPMMVGVSVRTQ